MRGRSSPKKQNVAAKELKQNSLRHARMYKVPVGEHMVGISGVFGGDVVGGDGVKDGGGEISGGDAIGGGEIIGGGEVAFAKESSFFGMGDLGIGVFDDGGIGDLAPICLANIDKPGDGDLPAPKTLNIFPSLGVGLRFPPVSSVKSFKRPIKVSP